MTYLASVFFAIPAIVMVIYNAVNISLIGPLFDTILPNGGIMFILYLIPHGIFEITATIPNPLREYFCSSSSGNSSRHGEAATPTAPEMLMKKQKRYCFKAWR